MKPLAIKLLCGIGSAGNSERAHKQYGLVQGSNRNSRKRLGALGPDKADKLTYIQANKMYMAGSKAARDWAITKMKGKKQNKGTELCLRLKEKNDCGWCLSALPGSIPGAVTARRFLLRF